MERFIAIKFYELIAWIEAIKALITSEIDLKSFKKLYDDRENMRKAIRLGFDNQGKTEKEFKAIFEKEFPGEEYK